MDDYSDMPYVNLTDMDLEMSMAQSGFSHDDSIAWSQTTDFRFMSQPVPSPTDSTRAPWPMPLPTNPQHMIPQELHGSFTSSQYGTHLVPPGPRTSFDNGTLYPIGNLSDDGPWSPHAMRTVGQNASSHRFTHPSASYRGFPAGPASDISSTAPRSDSGYITQRPGSVLSNEVERREPELPSEITQKVGNMNVGSVTSEPPEMTRVPSDQRSISQVSVRSNTRSKQLPCQVPGCKAVMKCQSDYKKHMLRHDKPFKCDFHGCTRDKGFTTSNDLDRHKKSIHKIGLDDKSYQCASEKCKSKTKVWPRLDNFKQHIERIHGDEDEDDLIKRSEYRPSSTLLTPVNTSLAGVGSGSSSVRNLDETISPLNLSAGYDRSLVPSYNRTPSDSALHVRRPTSQPNKNNSQEMKIPSRVPQPPVGVKTRKNGALAQRDQSDILNGIVLDNKLLEKQRSEPHPQLSNAPQTKSDQQRQTQRKSARINNADMKTHPSIPDQARLEQTVLNILSEGSSPRQTAQTIVARLFKQITKSTTATSRRLTPDPPPNAKSVTCTICFSQVSRVCDLNKHMKRHKKPYGCTYPQCNKRFGAKSDWKRHENSQHFQLEAYRCTHILSDTGKACGNHFHRADLFKAHLTTEHEVPSTQMASHLKRSKIGRNCQVQHWCGFCQEIRPLKEKRNEAWDERFDHIAFHFEKEKKSIEEWLCAEANKTKKRLLEEMRGEVFDDDEETLGKASPGEDSINVDMDAAGESDDSQTFQLPPPIVLSTSPYLSNQRKRKRTASPPPYDEPLERERQFTWTCCACSDGMYHTYKLHEACMMCQHPRCDTCPIMESDVRTAP